MTDLDLAGIWTVLGSSAPKHGDEIVTLETGLTLPAGQILLGVDSRGWRHLLVPLLPGEAARTRSRGRVRLGRVNAGGSARLSVYCTDAALDKVFTQFATELLVGIAEAHSPALATADAFQAWRSMFDADPLRQSPADVISGLIGELVTVAFVLDRGGAPGLDWWTGPEGTVHDLRSGARALEVKTSHVREGRFTTIHGLAQLDAPHGGSLHLQLHQVESDPEGLNLAAAVEAVERLGADQDVVATRLRKVGVTTADLSPDSSHRLGFRQSLLYDVEESGFPRITADSFVGGSSPAGTLRLTYVVDLTGISPTPLKADEVEAVLTVFAEATVGDET